MLQHLQKVYIKRVLHIHHSVVSKYPKGPSPADVSYGSKYYMRKNRFGIDPDLERARWAKKKS